MFILFEHASGYSLFAVKQFEEISSQMAAVEKSILDFGKFSSLVFLQAHSPFENAEVALEECVAISEGTLPPMLTNFLELNMPASNDKEKQTLGISDAKLGQAICARLPWIRCVHVDIVPELIRGIRYHLVKYLKKLDATDERNAQLGLGHGLARSKVKFNVNRADNMIMQAISLIDQMDKNINGFVMRIREWYSYHFPELYKMVPDMYLFCKCTEYIAERATFTEDKVAGLAEILQDEEKANEIFEASRSTIGMDISAVDLVNIKRFCTKVLSLIEYRRNMLLYLKGRMDSCAPNLSALIGELVGARLISQAGSLNNLAKYPASTIQILGAEKALFRALRKRGNTPKYGLLFHSSFISKAASKDKGKISRFVANKCAIASRIDCFSEIPVNTYGEHLKSQVEERLKLFESGVIPKKNAEVMREAIVEAKEQEAIVIRKIEKAKRKALKRARIAQSDKDETGATDETSRISLDDELAVKKKKKKKSQLADDDQLPVADLQTTVCDDEQEPPVKKKKKKKKSDQVEVSSF